MLEIRPIEDEEVEEAQTILAYSFDWTDARRSIAGAVDEFHRVGRKEWTMAAFVDQRMVAYMQWRPLVMRIAGHSLPFAAAGPGATLPQYRGQGNQRELVRHAIYEMRSAGCMWSGLHTPIAGWHRRNGWEIAAVRRRYLFCPKDVRVQKPTVVGTINFADPGAWQVFDKIYRLHSESRNGALHRSESWWREDVLGHDPIVGGARDAAVWYDNADNPGGYVIYTQSNNQLPDGATRKRLEVFELLALEPSGYLSLIRFLLSHNLVDEIDWPASPDDLLLAFVDDPARVRVEERYDMMLRMIDVPMALAARIGKSCESENEGFRIEVRDPLAPWNAKVWKVDLCAGNAAVLPTDEEPDMIVDARYLGPLYNGYISPGQAARAGMLAVQHAEKLKRLEQVLAVNHPPFCADTF